MQQKIQEVHMPIQINYANANTLLYILGLDITTGSLHCFIMIMVN